MIALRCYRSQKVHIGWYNGFIVDKIALLCEDIAVHISIHRHLRKGVSPRACVPDLPSIFGYKYQAPVILATRS